MVFVSWMKSVCFYRSRFSEHENDLENFNSLHFPGTMNKEQALYTIFLTYFKLNWLAWIKCATSSPVQYAQVQENTLLTSSSNPLTSKVHFPWYHFLHFWDSTIKIFAVPVIHCPKFFSNSGGNEENGSLKVICLLIYYRKKLDFQQVTGRFKRCCIPRSLAATSQQIFHALCTLLHRMWPKCFSLKGLQICRLQKTPIFFQHFFLCIDQRAA